MWIAIDSNCKMPLNRQIYNRIREMILNGTLISGEKLPSTRRLSKDLGVSRNTILEVYNQMIAEGYLEGHHGSGTVVAGGMQDLKFPVNSVNGYRSEDEFNRKKSINNKEEVQKQLRIDFRSGVPALELFPQKAWAKLYQNTCCNLPAASYGYCSSSGVWALREEISRYLSRSRGISCTPERIIITSGATQGLSLAAHLLNQENKNVLVEDPTHPGLRKVITTAGCRIKTHPTDERGIKTELLNPADPLSFIYTTPSHQYPLGGILPIQRRLSLLSFAEANNCYVVEDDYDSEFRYEGPPVNALYELNPERVIYLGSFSKILTPAIRLGFMILPDPLLKDCKTLKTYSDVHTDALSQYTLAEFIRDGSLEKHIWKTKKYYHKNRNHLIRELTRQFAGEFHILGQAAGLHMVVQFHNTVFSKELVQEIEHHGVRIYPVENYLLEHSDTSHSNQILMGYSHLNFEAITAGVDILGEIIP